MSSSRREFVGRSLAAAGLLALPKHFHSFAFTPPPKASKPLRILFLGGTGFIGPHMVRYSMARGHKVTLFNRGKTAPDLFPGAETLTGDRDNGLDSLKGGKWDVVIDNSGYVPRHVRDSAELLKDSVSRYIFTSTGSVYKFDQDYITEESPLQPVEDPTSEDVNKYYGPLKVLCEEAVRKNYGDRATILRLHMVAGVGDPTDRFTYWPVRVDRGGEIVAPGDKNNPVQYIDVDDLSEFAVRAGENNTSGTFNIAGPTTNELGMAKFLDEVKSITKTPGKFVWVDDAFVAEQKGRIPLWVSQHGPARGIVRVRSQKAIAAGLTFRPVSETAKKTLDWFKSQPQDRQDRMKPVFEGEAKLLEAWKAKGGR